MKSIQTLLALVLSTFMSLAQAGHHEGDGEAPQGGGRVMAMEVQAVITAIDTETKEVTISTGEGMYVTVVAQEKLVKVEDLNVGDVVVVDYLVSIEGELRAPTEEEKMNPWVVLDDEVVDTASATPGLGAARQIRAVCTIEAANRMGGYVMIKDSRGKLHTIRDIEPEKFDGVSLGDSIVVVYTEAMAVSLVPVSEDVM